MKSHPPLNWSGITLPIINCYAASENTAVLDKVKLLRILRSMPICNDGIETQHRGGMGMG